MLEELNLGPSKTEKEKTIQSKGQEKESQSNSNNSNYNNNNNSSNNSKIDIKKKLNVLEVGAINIQLQQYHWLDVRSIDLNSQHPLIEECDFFDIIPSSFYDVVVCSMVGRGVICFLVFLFLFPLSSFSLSI